MNSINKSTQNSVHHLEWPEEAVTNERELFYLKLLSLLSTGEWVAIISNPAPLGAIRTSIESDCKNLLQPIGRPFDGVAWLCEYSNVLKVLPGIFQARRPELVFLTFNKKSLLEDISNALNSKDASPALSLLAFDDSKLIELTGAGLKH